MSTIKLGKSVTSYKRYTPVQLASTIRQLQKQFISVAKANKPVRGKSPQAQLNAIASEIRKVATVLRANVVKQINVKIRTLKTMHAKNLGIKATSPKAFSIAAKRLKLKLAMIKKANRASTLIKLCTALKLSAYKNPIVKSTTRTRTTTTVRRSTRARTRKSPIATKRTTTRKLAKSPAKMHVHHKRQTKILKKEIHKLKKRNSFMRRLVNQFRRKVAKLKRSYRAANAKPRWKVVNGKGTSNVVRFHRSSSATWNKQASRKAS